MKEITRHIASLCENALTLLAKEQERTHARAESIAELIACLQAGNKDRRLQRLSALFKEWRQQSDSLTQLIHDDLIGRVRQEAEALAGRSADTRLDAVLTALLATQTFTLNQGSESLLDALIEQTGAERGFILFWVPESTEADILAARNFQSKVLSTGEYRYSRTLLRTVLEGRPLSVEDASEHPIYGGAPSVKEYQIRSVLAVPLKDGSRTAGAIYLENNLRLGAFRADDLPLLESAARFFMFALQNSRLLPVALPPATSVFLDAAQAPTEIIGQDPVFLELLDLVRRIADSPAAVLIEGASGTGKELVARALHSQSCRQERPFVTINCAAIPDTLLESELFGHEKGAFTGAADLYIGQVEQADGGTVFFDEVGELPLPLQSKLLRFLQSGEFHRLGGKGKRHVDVRVVAATSRDLQKMMQEGRFLEALYFRLKVIPIRLPELSERKGDIPLLIEHFRGKFAAMYDRPVQIEPGVIAVLKEHPSPGNVRELENLVHRLVALSPDGRISLGDLPRDVLQTSSKRVQLGPPSPLQPLLTPLHSLEELRQRRETLKKVLDDQERQLIRQVITDCGGSITEAARRLGLHRVTLHKILKESSSQ